MALYWDANVFLSYLNDEAPDRTATQQALLQLSDGDKATAKIYTSTLTQVEVSFAASEKMQQKLDTEQEQRIDDLFISSGTVTLLPLTTTISALAKGLIRQTLSRGWSLKPADAIHLATAQWLSNTGIPVAEFHTYDRNLMKYGALVDFEITEPRIGQPALI